MPSGDDGLCVLRMRSGMIEIRLLLDRGAASCCTANHDEKASLRGRVGEGSFVPVDFHSKILTATVFCWNVASKAELLERRVACRLEAAISRLSPLIGIALFSATLQCAAADSAVSLQIKHGEEAHAVVTDLPDIVDMSYANPKTWDLLPLAPPLNDWSSEVLLQGSGFKAAIA